MQRSDSAHETQPVGHLIADLCQLLIANSAQIQAPTTMPTVSAAKLRIHRNRNINLLVLRDRRNHSPGYAASSIRTEVIFPWSFACHLSHWPLPCNKSVQWPKVSKSTP